MDQSQSSFVMKNARRAIEQGLHHIEQQVDAIERAVFDQSGLAFDLARTLVESTCRTILTDRGVTYGTRDDLSTLFRSISRTLPILPPEESQESDVRQSIVLTLQGLSNVVRGISDLRNKLGFASHGADRLRPIMEPMHALLSAQTADIIVGFLYYCHVGDRTVYVARESSPSRHAVLIDI